MYIPTFTWTLSLMVLMLLLPGLFEFVFIHKILLELRDEFSLFFSLFVLFQINYLNFINLIGIFVTIRQLLFIFLLLLMIIDENVRLSNIFSIILFLIFPWIIFRECWSSIFSFSSLYIFRFVDFFNLLLFYLPCFML